MSRWNPEIPAKTRKQLYITPEQDKYLKAESKKIEIPVAEIVRRAIDQYKINNLGV